MEGEPKPGQRLDQPDFERVLRCAPLVAIDLIVRFTDGRYLLGWRVNEPAQGSLFVPGGRITKNETLSSAFSRLALEEIGMPWNLSDSLFLGVFEHFYTVNVFNRPGFGTHYIVLAYQIELEPAHASKSFPKAQHTEYQRLSPEEIEASRDVHENSKVYFRKT